MVEVVRARAISRVTLADFLQHLPGADGGEPHKPTVKDEAARDHAGGSYAPAPPNAALAEWLQGRVTWFVRALAGALPSIEDGAHIAFILQVRLCRVHRSSVVLETLTRSTFRIAAMHLRCPPCRPTRR